MSKTQRDRENSFNDITITEHTVSILSETLMCILPVAQCSIGEINDAIPLHHPHVHVPPMDVSIPV